MNIDFSKIISDKDLKSEAERLWRDGELSRADIELNKLQDGMKTGISVTQWREYRVSLRNWPEAEDFPLQTSRPVSPDKN